MKLLLVFAYHRLAFLSRGAGSVCISEPGREERASRKGEVQTFSVPPVYFVCVR